MAIKCKSDVVQPELSPDEKRVNKVAPKLSAGSNKPLLTEKDVGGSINSNTPKASDTVIDANKPLLREEGDPEIEDTSEDETIPEPSIKPPVYKMPKTINSKTKKGWMKVSILDIVGLIPFNLKDAIKALKERVNRIDFRRAIIQYLKGTFLMILEMLGILDIIMMIITIVKLAYGIILVVYHIASSITLPPNGGIAQAIRVVVEKVKGIVITLIKRVIDSIVNMLLNAKIIPMPKAVYDLFVALKAIPSFAPPRQI
jgi:hypothetical protein